LTRALAAVACSLLLLLAVLEGAWAQSAPQLEIVAVEHDPRGVISASVVADTGAAVDPREVTALVDGVPRQVELLPEPSSPLSIVVAIETSSSMRGARLQTAQSLALDFIDRLGTADRVAVVSFGDAATVVHDFSTDRPAARAAVQSLTPTTLSALYDGVVVASGLIEVAPTGAGALVLITYGWDFGSASSGRAESLTAVAAAGAPAYVVALGPDNDAAYLQALAAAAPDGAFWPSGAVSDPGAALASATAALRGGGTRSILTIMVPPLALGEHALTVRYGGDAAPVEAVRSFEVGNEGLITAAIAELPADGTALVVQVEALTRLDELALEATAGAEPLEVDARTGRITLDPWSFDPGPLQVNIIARVEGEVAAAIQTVIDVPALAPWLELALDDPEAPTELVVTGRVQGAEAPLLVVTIDGAEAARSMSGEVRLPVDEATEVVARLEDRSGRALATRSLAVGAVAAGSGGAPLAVPVSAGGAAATAAVAAVAGGLAYWLRRRLRRRSGGTAPSRGLGWGWWPRARWLGNGPIEKRHLRYALKHEQFILHYQPVVDVSSGSVTGLEALVRWQLPNGQTVPPARFMSVAEASGLIVPLGEWVLRTACSYVRSLQLKQSPQLRVSVNLSWRQLHDPNLASTVERALEDAGLAPEFLALEVAEQDAALDVSATAEALEPLYALGLSITLDDFGLGAESKEHLEQLGVRSVKVDLWEAIRGEEAQAAVIEAVKAAHALGARVTAKGVGTPQALELLRKLDVECVQGYAFGGPATAPNVSEAERHARLVAEGLSKPEAAA
jgi:EAL domain-containing protein (putative c-di-GMP-specific phosphodiesterase class I)